MKILMPKQLPKVRKLSSSDGKARTLAPSPSGAKPEARSQVLGTQEGRPFPASEHRGPRAGLPARHLCMSKAESGAQGH